MFELLLLLMIAVGTQAYCKHELPEKHTSVCEGETAPFNWNPERVDTFEGVYFFKTSPENKNTILIERHSNGNDTIALERANFLGNSSHSFEMANVTMSDNGPYRIELIHDKTLSCIVIHLHVIKGAGCPNPTAFMKPDVYVKLNLIDDDPAVVKPNGPNNLTVIQAGSTILGFTVPAADPPVEASITKGALRINCTGEKEFASPCEANWYLGQRDYEEIFVELKYIAYQPSITKLSVYREVVSPADSAPSKKEEALPLTNTKWKTATIVLIVFTILLSVFAIAACIYVMWIKRLGPLRNEAHRQMIIRLMTCDYLLNRQRPENEDLRNGVRNTSTASNRSSSAPTEPSRPTNDSQREGELVPMLNRLPPPEIRQPTPASDQPLIISEPARERDKHPTMCTESDSETGRKTGVCRAPSTLASIAKTCLARNSTSPENIPAALQEYDYDGHNHSAAISSVKGETIKQPSNCGQETSTDQDRLRTSPVATIAPVHDGDSIQMPSDGNEFNAAERNKKAKIQQPASDAYEEFEDIRKLNQTPSKPPPDNEKQRQENTVLDHNHTSQITEEYKNKKESDRKTKIHQPASDADEEFEDIRKQKQTPRKLPPAYDDQGSVSTVVDLSQVPEDDMINNKTRSWDFLLLLLFWKKHVDFGGNESDKRGEQDWNENIT